MKKKAVALVLRQFQPEQHLVFYPGRHAFLPSPPCSFPNWLLTLIALTAQMCPGAVSTRSSFFLVLHTHL